MTGTKLSRKALALKQRLADGPVVLGDVIELTTSAADLGKWADELVRAGLPVRRERRDGAVVYLLGKEART